MQTAPPEPFSSVSTPVYITSQPLTKKPDQLQKQWHTRPKSALAMLTDSSEDECDEDDHLETFQRISGILSHLIEEASEAVYDFPESNQVDCLYSSSPTSFLASSRRDSRVSSISSCDTLFSPHPLSIESPPSPTIIPPSPTTRRFHYRKPSRSLVSPTSASRPRLPGRPKRDPLSESYRRLNSSIALVDSLSRDLVPTASGTSALSALLLLPLLHIPHTLITMVFDSLSHLSFPAEPTKQHNVTGMVAWVFFFTIANIMVDRAVRTQPAGEPVQTNTRPLLLPGTYTSKDPLSVQTRTRHRRPASRRSHRKRRCSLLSGDAKRMHITRAFLPQTQQGHTRMQPDPAQVNRRRNSL